MIHMNSVGLKPWINIGIVVETPVTVTSLHKDRFGKNGTRLLPIDDQPVEQLRQGIDLVIMP